MSSIDLVILGIVLEKPQSAYDIEMSKGKNKAPSGAIKHNTYITVHTYKRKVEREQKTKWKIKFKKERASHWSL